jgi:disease resistance protein RPM1
LSTLLPKLAVLLTSQYNLQKNLRNDITFLKAELESMQPVLERVSEAPITDKQIMIWAREVRELLYGIFFPESVHWHVLR